MNKRKKLLAIMGALVLTVGTVGVALAEDLKDDHAGLWFGWDEEGNPQVLDGETDVTDDWVGVEECDGVELEEGQLLFHFVLSPTDADSGNLTVDFDPGPDWGPEGADGNQGSQLDWDVLVDGPQTVVGATTDVDDTNEQVDGLKISHICFGDAPGDEETDEPEETPEFSADEGGETDAPSEPNTATIGGNGTSGPADGAWLLVVALGVLLASVVVMTPARAKSRR